MDVLSLGTMLYHPCSIDILEWRVIAVHLSDSGVAYTITNTKPVGRYVRSDLDVIVYHNTHDQIWYMDMVEDSQSSGLWDFVEGRYYVDIKHAQKAYRTNILCLLEAKRDNAKRLYDQADQAVVLMVKSLASIDG